MVIQGFGAVLWDLLVTVRDDAVEVLVVVAFQDLLPHTASHARRDAGPVERSLHEALKDGNPSRQLFELRCRHPLSAEDHLQNPLASDSIIHEFDSEV